jgi:hypothetical protein
MTYSKSDRVVCVYARKASGPGWRNRPLWVVLEDRRTGKMREECLQPSEQSEGMQCLYDIASEVDAAMMGAVEGVLNKRMKGVE